MFFSPVLCCSHRAGPLTERHHQLAPLSRGICRPFFFIAVTVSDDVNLLFFHFRWKCISFFFWISSGFYMLCLLPQVYQHAKEREKGNSHSYCTYGALREAASACWTYVATQVNVRAMPLWPPNEKKLAHPPLRSSCVALFPSRIHYHCCSPPPTQPLFDTVLVGTLQTNNYHVFISAIIKFWRLRTDTRALIHLYYSPTRNKAANVTRSKSCSRFWHSFSPQAALW